MGVSCKGAAVAGKSTLWRLADNDVTLCKTTNTPGVVNTVEWVSRSTAYTIQSATKITLNAQKRLLWTKGVTENAMERMMENSVLFVPVLNIIIVI